ncbi:hypothetical protein JCM10213_002116 [Rhodosporidiobolus nylandii]
MAQPTELLASSALSIVLPATPSLLSSAPPPTTFARAVDANAAAETDAWVCEVVRSEQRTALYYDEPLRFLLALTLPHPTSSTPSTPSPPLSRHEAAALLLRSLSSPHISLNADLSFVEGARYAAPFPPPASSVSFAAQQQAQPPLPPRASSLVGLAAKAPLTPSPLPSTLPQEGDAAGQALPGVPVASVAYKEEDGRMWVGQDADGRWVGLWEMNATIPFLRSQLREPKLSITVTVTLRDDPRLEGVLVRAKEGILPGDAGAESADELLDEDEEYMEKGWGDVNLLSGLAPVSSEPLHLPFSRLPSAYLPTPPSSHTTPSHARSRSRSYSLTASSHGDSLPLHPSMRRSTRRLLPVHSALQLNMRTVPCPVGALGIPPGGRIWERDDEDGVILSVEVTGPSSTEEGFEIDSIEVSVEGGAPAGSATARREMNDIEVREVRTPGVDFPLRLEGGGTTQHNFLYALAMVPSVSGSLARASASVDGGQVEEPLETVPIAVASSPSQRFAARFGAEEVTEQATGQVLGEIALRRGSVAPVPPGASEAAMGQQAWPRSVAIMVTGRPLIGGSRAKEGGYVVPDAAEVAEKEEEGEDGETESPTLAFSSRWTCTLDISSFARRSPSRAAFFSPTAAPPSSRPASIRAPLLSTPSLPLTSSIPLRPRSLQNQQPEVESIAGSKRHSMSSLAALSIKSPVLNRRGSAFNFPPPALDGTRRPSRALPPTPMSPPAPSPGFASFSTPGATGPPRRFFDPSPADVGSAASLSNGLQKEEPPVLSASPQAQRTSLPERAGPSGGGLAVDRTRDTKRTSWMSSLVGGSSTSLATSPQRASSLNVTSSSAGAAGGGTSWDRPSSVPPGVAAGSTVGLGLEEAPSLPVPAISGSVATTASTAPQQFYQQDELGDGGKLLISVSLVPLRTAVSRRAKKAPLSGTSTPAGPAHLPPPTPPGLAPASPLAEGTPRFSFPPSAPASPDPASSSTPPSPLPPPSPAASAHAAAQQQALATSRMPRVNLLDVFLVEVFVTNQGEGVRLFTVGVAPEKVGRKDGWEARVIPLENDVRIGPLAPHTSSSAHLRFLACQPGAWCIPPLRLVDTGGGGGSAAEVRLEGAVWVVVE